MKNQGNKADGEIADQPCSFFLRMRRMFYRGTPNDQFGSWINFVPILILLATALTFRAISSHQTPPMMQAFVPLPATTRLSNIRPKMTEPVIRVNVTPGGVESLQLDVRGRCEVIAIESQKRLSDTPISGTITVTSTKAGLKLGSNQFTTHQLELVPEQSPSIRVNGHLYRGKMRLFRRSDGNVSAVNVLPIEEYLASVVDSEMPAKFPDEARQAQAIVARTYALYQIEQVDPKAVYDLLSSQRSQKYLGVEFKGEKGRRLAGESENSRRVIAATRGIVCQKDGKLFCTYYSAVCGGQTTHGRSVFKDASEVLCSVPCEWCRESPHYRWKTQLEHDDFKKRILKRDGNSADTNAISTIRQASGPGDGVVSRFEIYDGQRNHSFSGIELRERLPTGTVWSPHFTMKLEGETIVFEGRGHGHGVGFCQWGAKGQAEAGRATFEIIRHYFPGVEIVNLNY